MCLVLLIAPAVLMLPALAAGQIPLFMDPLMYFFPQRVHAAHLLGSGQAPLWNRCLMGGMPLFENPQAALAYPLNWPFLVRPSGFLFLMPLLLQLGLYAALAAWAAWRLGTGPWTGFWAGVLALAGGYGWSRLQYGNYMNVLPWWPLWLGAAHQWARTLNARWVAVGAGAVAMMLLAGAHQLAAYGLAALAVYFLVQALTDEQGPRRWLAYGLGTLLIGLALGAPGWLPQWGFLAETSRAEGISAERVLAGSIHSWGELVRALVGDWGPLSWKPSGRWADAESSATIGLAALALAAIIPLPGSMRRAWLGLWVAVLVSILLSLHIVMEPLIRVFPAARLFHGPRRWLGVTQWLLTPAAAIGAASLWERWRESTRPSASGEANIDPLGVAPDELGVYDPDSARAGPDNVGPSAVPSPASSILPRIPSPLGRLTYLAPALALTLATLPALIVQNRLVAVLHADLVLLMLVGAYCFWRAWGRVVVAGAMILVVALLGHATWVTTDLGMITTAPLLEPDPPPLIAKADLGPGERFFTLDWQRGSSYDFRRPDLTSWALPNLGQLWGVEDLGGYEPAQSRWYRAFMGGIHAADPPRQPYPDHFGHIQQPMARDAFNRGNVRALLMPRWGVPLFMRSTGEGKGLWGGAFPAFLEGPFDVQLVYAGPEQGETVELYAMSEEMLAPIELSAPNTLDRRADLALGRVQLGALPPSLGHGRLLMAKGTVSALHQRRVGLLARLAEPNQLFDGFVWNAALAELWRPEATTALAALMRYQGDPTWTHWSAGDGRVLSHKIRANHLELEVEVSEAPPPFDEAELVIHDAWWPGWRAWVDDDEVAVGADDLWRAIRVPPGRHTVKMTYRPRHVTLSLALAAWGAVAIALLCLRRRRPRSRVE